MKRLKVLHQKQGFPSQRIIDAAPDLPPASTASKKRRLASKVLRGQALTRFTRIPWYSAPRYYDAESGG